MAVSFLQKLDAYPPVRCRLLAVHYPSKSKYGWPVPLTDEEISARSGIGIGLIRDLSVLTTWHDVEVRKLRGFMAGCHLNFDNWSSFRRTARLAKREKFHYLRRHPLWATQFEPLVKLWIYAREQRR